MGFAGSFNVYLKRRVIFVFLLGISSGFPVALIGTTLGYWLGREHVDIKIITYFALAGTAYSLKFVWSPLIDKLHLPLFCDLLGRRKGWMLFTQIVLIIAIIAMGNTNPITNLSMLAWLAVIVAFSSASQDIVIDAYRIEILKDDEQGAGAAAVTFGWRLGAQIIAGAGALYLAAANLDWNIIYTILSATALFGMAIAIFGPRPEIESRIAEKKNFADWFADAFINPFKSFADNRGWWVFLLFIIFFKMGDAMMSGPLMGGFYAKLDFAPETIATVTKGVGFIATILGSILAGAVIKKIGIIKTLWIGAFFQASTNLIYSVLFEAGHNLTILMLAIGLDNFSGAMGTIAFVAFISQLCNLEYTATQYALLSSLSAVGRTTVAATGGIIVDAIGWVNFFIFTAIAAAPGIILLFFITKYFVKPVDKPGAAA